MKPDQLRGKLRFRTRRGILGDQNFPLPSLLGNDVPNRSDITLIILRFSVQHSIVDAYILLN